MKTTSEAILLDTLIKENYYRPIENIRKIVRENDLIINDSRLKRLITIEREKHGQGGGAYFNGQEWHDRTPDSHRQTKAYNDMIRSEIITPCEVGCRELKN